MPGWHPRPASAGMGAMDPGAEDDAARPPDLDGHEAVVSEQPLANLDRLVPVQVACELGWPHVVHEEDATTVERPDRVVEPLPLPALGIGEDQVPAAASPHHLTSVSYLDLHEGWPP